MWPRQQVLPELVMTSKVSYSLYICQSKLSIFFFCGCFDLLWFFWLGQESVFFSNVRKDFLVPQNNYKWSKRSRSKLMEVVLDLPAKQHRQLSPIFKANGLDWQCLLVGSSGIFIFSIAMVADYPLSLIQLRHKAHNLWT